MAPCQNGGTCVNIDNGNDYLCQCLPGFEGKDCESKYFISIFLLFHFLFAVNPYGPDPDNGATDPICVISQPCQNGGTCVNIDSGNDYLCQCLPGFEGKDCESMCISLI